MESLPKVTSGTTSSLMPDQEAELYKAGQLEKTGDYEAAFGKFKKLADESNNPDACYKVGHFYYYGKGTPKDLNEAMTYFRKYLNVCGLDQDYVAVHLKYADARLKMGNIHLKNKEMYQARNCFEDARDKGSVGAYTALGTMYYFGYCGWRRLDKAKDFFTGACRQDPAAHMQLGLMYVLGDEVERSDEKAISHLTKAANGGIQIARAMLALVHHYQKDTQKSEECIDALPQLNPNFPNDINTLINFFKTHAQECLDEKDYWKALTYLRFLEPINDKDVQFQIGIMYQQGLGVDKDNAIAREYLMQAHVNGHPEAAFEMGKSYDEQSLIKFWGPSSVNTRACFLQVSTDCDGKTSYEIATYLEGYGYPGDDQRIQEHLENAKAKGHEDAKHKLDQRKMTLEKTKSESASVWGNFFGKEKDNGVHELDNFSG